MYIQLYERRSNQKWNFSRENVWDPRKTVRYAVASIENYKWVRARKKKKRHKQTNTQQQFQHSERWMNYGITEWLARKSCAGQVKSKHRKAFWFYNDRGEWYKRDFCLIICTNSSPTSPEREENRKMSVDLISTEEIDTQSDLTDDKCYTAPCRIGQCWSLITDSPAQVKEKEVFRWV